MTRFLFAAAVLLAAVQSAPAKRIAAPPPPVQRALSAEMVVVGKVTAIEKDTVDAIPNPGAPQKVPYKVAVVKVETPLAGADGLTHLKVGFLAPTGPPRRGLPVVGLTEGQEVLLFLTKHPSGQFYSYTWMSAPVDGGAEDYKQQVAAVKKALAIVADPMKALKTQTPEDRTFAAVVLIHKYRTQPTDGEAKTESVPAEESRLILQGLAGETDWNRAKGGQTSAMQAFYRLGLTEKEGWTPPKPQPGADYAAAVRKAFAAWVDGPGKDYRINRYVAGKAGR